MMELPDLSNDVVAFTGHRPQRLGGYGPEAALAIRRLAARVITVTLPKRVISGMALGWDQAIVIEALNHGIPVTAAIPFEGQESQWPEHAQKLYHLLMGDKNLTVHCVTPGGYSVQAMQVRNQFMVDHASHLIALWDGKKSGTSNCVNYAKFVKLPTTNVWPLWGKINTI